MTNTLPQNGTKAGSAQRPVRKGPESAIGLQRHKRTATDIGLALITPFVGQEFLDGPDLDQRSQLSNENSWIFPIDIDRLSIAGRIGK